MLLQGKDGELRLIDSGVTILEYITNGDFDTDSDWTKGTNWVIANTVATHSGDTASGLTQAVDIEAIKKYRVIFTVSKVTAAGDGIAVYLGGTAGTTRTTAATFEEYLTTTDAGDINLWAGVSFEGDIDDVEVRRADSGTSYYMKVLFCEMDTSFPTSRPRTEETLVMDRGNFDSNAHYIEGNDEPVFAPMDFSFSCRLADTTDTRALAEWVSGITEVHNAVGGVTQLYSWDESGTIYRSTTLPAFRDTGKNSYRVQVVWDGATDLGYQLTGVYFPPGEQTIGEGADGLTFSANGQIFGDVTRIAAFTNGTSIIAFS